MQGTDQTGKVHESRPNVPADNDDVATLAAWVVQKDAQLPSDEVREEASRARNNKTEPAQHQPQADLYRGTLAELMQIEDALEFSESLLWFRAFEIEAGANTNARANYLGVPRAEYVLVESRFNQIQGVVTVLEADAERVWSDEGNW